MRILVTGASGYAGGFLCRELARRHTAVGTCRGQPTTPGMISWDMENVDSVRAVLAKEAWDLVIHAAGRVHLVDCEQNGSQTYAINVQGTHDIARWAPCRVLYLSTDYVFDGAKPTYTESDLPAPLMAYGRQKLEAERRVLESGDHLVVRVPFLYGWSPTRNSFLDRFRGPTTNAAHDVHCNPLYLGDLVTRLEELLQATGVVHFGGATEISRFDFFQRVRDALSLPTKIIAVSREVAFADGIARPKSSILRSDKLSFRGRSLEEGLAALKHDSSSSRPA